MAWITSDGFVSVGASTVIGQSNGVAANKKKYEMKKSDGTATFCSLHCILHYGALCAKITEMIQAINTAVKAVKFILANALGSHVFYHVWAKQKVIMVKEFTELV